MNNFNIVLPDARTLDLEILYRSSLVSVFSFSYYALPLEETIENAEKNSAITVRYLARFAKLLKFRVIYGY